MSAGEAAVRAAVAEAHRREWAAVLAATVRIAGNLDLAEDCAQEAFASALAAWQRTGIPRNAGAWLTTAARNKALDTHRRSRLLRAKLPALAAEQSNRPDPTLPGDPDPAIADDRLRLIFTCCHPALARDAQVALTLRLLCGLSTPEIARAFLVSESTMAARVTRAKKKIAAARIPYRVPDGHELADRLDAVLTVVHLVFSTGHTAPSGQQLVRTDLVDRALELARLLVQLMPDEREVRGLLALVLVTTARGSGRVDDAGELVLLRDQDRSGWDAELIEEAHQLLLGALRGTAPGRFVLQAAIASLHAQAPSEQETDWPQILGLYDLLVRAWPSPVVALNRAVALAMVDGASAGLQAIDAIDQAALAGYHYLPAARAELLHRLGRNDEAAAAYRQALDRVSNEPERRFLMRQMSIASSTATCTR